VDATPTIGTFIVSVLVHPTYDLNTISLAGGMCNCAQLPWGPRVQYTSIV
jgi:hypothetical protein